MQRTALGLVVVLFSASMASCGGRSSDSETQRTSGSDTDDSPGPAIDGPDDGPSQDSGAPPMNMGDTPGPGAASGGPTGQEPNPSTPVDGPKPDPTTPSSPSDPSTPTPSPVDPAPGQQQPGPRPECPGACAVSALCNLCDDSSCAVPSVACNPDGSCGATTWTCPEGEKPSPTPAPSAPTDWENPCAGKACGDSCDSCPPDTVCLVGPGVCDPKGACVQVDPMCEGSPAAPSCEQDSECSVPAGCLKCNNGEEWCPSPRCIEGSCGTSPNLCPESYKPCDGLEEGDTCTICSPLDSECDEPSGDKTCVAGSCTPTVLAE